MKNKKINFLAISKFPHSSFFPYLEKSLEKEYENLDYYQAITSYCTKESLVLLDKLFEKILVENKSFALLGDELLDYLAKYIEEKNCPEHQDFLAKINDHFNSNSP
jgi:bacterioferritin (cytochrome b1)